MILTTAFSQRTRFFACLIITSMSASAAEQSTTLNMHALIANKGLSCQINVPENTLKFKPLQSNQLMGAIQTYQIQPLRMQLICGSEQEALLPTLTVEGVTPYSDDQNNVIFLNGQPNGVGFMLRQAKDDNAISLANFYQPDQAIGQGKKGNTLALLDNNNNYQSETLLWVGLVGPFQSNIIPGDFHAALTLNVAFE